MRTANVLCLSACLLLLSAGQAAAQGRWTIEVRGGVNFPVEEFLELDLERGFGFEGTIGFDIVPGLGLYGGWDWQRRELEVFPFVQGTVDVEDTGYVFGIRYMPPAGPVSPWLRAGGIYNHVELEDQAGDIFADSDHTLGFEVGAGLQFRVGESFALTPGVRYRRFEPDVRGGPLPERSVTMSYFTAEVGIAVRF